MITVAGNLTSIAPLIAKIPNYSAFNNALRANILKSKMARKYTNIPAQYLTGTNIDTSAHFIVANGDANILGLFKSYLSREHYTWMKITNLGGSIPNQISQTSTVNIQNKSHSDSNSISQAELNTLQSQQKQLDFSNYLRVPNKYMPERPSDEYGVNSEKFIHCDLINPTSSASQIIESLANNLYKKVSNMFSAKTVQSKKNIEVDSDEELADRIGKLSINKTLLKGFEAEVHAVIKSSKHCCSNCNRTKHNSQPKSHKKSKSKQTVLEQTIHKIIQSELKDILLLLLQKLNFNNEKLYHIQDNIYREPAPEISNSDEDETLDDPMEIDFYLKISTMILDSRAETEIVTEDIVKHINRKIDRSVKYDLSGIATIPIESIDGSHNEDTITSKPLISDQILQKVDSNKDDSILLEEWHAPAVINEHKQIQNKNTNLISHNAQKDIFIVKSKAENIMKSKKIKSLEFMIKILKNKLSSVQKDVILIQNNLLKKESKILSLKSKIVEIEHKLALKVSELECLKSEAILNSILGRNNEKNITKSNDISAVIELSKNLRQYFVCRKSMN
ncbi:3432_t:CDS:2 [Cetraspora pellucida]|uniref:3432_t:CDS:1 n=1 Tax=Cetraspora pellucida TaxID=1433469 RepID=A0A9N9E7H1_9GLOM|nr:3432_t:CDS:2 [Cetraspora pellucida]